MIPSPARFRLAVLNPGGNDPDQAFPDRAGEVSERSHAPVNHHGYAAATAGNFYRKRGSIGRDEKEVLLLVRWDLALSLKNLRALQTPGRKVAVTLKESGAFQIAELIQRAKKFKLLEEICRTAGACIAGRPDLAAFYRAAGAERVEFIPTPYPVEDARWNFSVPFEKRQGIFAGTREFEVPSRNHLAAMLAMRELSRARGVTVTVINPEGRPGRQLLREMDFPPGKLRVVEGPAPYPEYARLMAGHRIVFQLDGSAVPGQVAGDALLCRVPCIGGNGAIEELIFPETCGQGRSVDELIGTAERLLEDAQENGRIAREAERLGMERVSFRAVAEKLEGFYGGLRGG